MIEKINKNLIAITIIVAGILIAGAVIFVNQQKTISPAPTASSESEILSPQEVGEKAIKFINENLLEEGMTASLVNVVEENGVYKFRLKIDEREYDSYVSKNGKLLFTQGIDLEKTPVIQPETPSIEEEDTKEESTIGAASLEALAKCLTEKGMKFYGAYWCGWCKKQKELFGEFAQYLPYVECSDKETGQITSECQKADITSFPTWKLPDGKKELGFKTLKQLAELSGCQL